MILYARSTFVTSFFCVAVLLFAANCRNATSETARANSNAGAASNDNAQATEDNSQATGNSAESSANVYSGEAAALVAEGRKHFEEFRNDEAVKSFERAREINPEEGEIHYRLGLALDDAGDKERAAESYERAVELFEQRLQDDEENIAVQRLLALTYSKLDKHAEAVKAYKQVARLAPDESYNHYELGVELMKLAQYPEAAQALKRATELDPDNYQAAEAYDRAREGVRRRDLAVKKQEEELRRQSSGDAALERPASAGGRVIPTLPIRVPKPSAPPTPPPTPKTP